jgi:hypothetical protein
MGDFVDRLRLKEAAEEDLYFAKQDKKLIEALREKKPAAAADSAEERDDGCAQAPEQPSEQTTGRPGGLSRSLLNAWGALLERIRGAGCRRTGR